jgi:hypothetical protein
MCPTYVAALDFQRLPVVTTYSFFWRPFILIEMRIIA